MWVFASPDGERQIAPWRPVRRDRWSALGRENAAQGDAEVHGEVRLEILVRLAAPGVGEHARVHDSAGVGFSGVGATALKPLSYPELDDGLAGNPG
jgi:hypothetical protein